MRSDDWQVATTTGTDHRMQGTRRIEALGRNLRPTTTGTDHRMQGTRRIEALGRNLRPTTTHAGISYTQRYVTYIAT